MFRIVSYNLAILEKNIDSAISRKFRTFYSPAHYEQLLVEDAMILFSVYDHDVLTYNDFGGEALFPVRDAAGIQKGKAGNFHGLKPVELPLMFQENNGKCTFDTVRKS